MQIQALFCLILLKKMRAEDIISKKNGADEGKDSNMDVATTVKKRVQWIKNILDSTGARGIVYGNSGGKDCTLVGALCKLATDNVLGVIMPCSSASNYAGDRDDALAAAKTFGIEQTEVDLTATKETLVGALGENLAGEERAVHSALININPRLRMITLYALAQSRGYLVAGTGNLCEATVGYFTKWGDGAYDLNPIADLTVPEVYEILEYLGAPRNIIEKAPSAGLYQGQTDESELGVSYADITAYIRGGELDEEKRARIGEMEKSTAHKRRMPLRYGEE